MKSPALIISPPQLNKKVEISFRLEYSLSASLLTAGVELIRRRFFEVWGVYRREVTEESLYRRKNLTFFDGPNLIGWLGIEDDGEFTNACIETGYHGIALLSKAIGLSYKVTNFSYMYADVPLINLASARAFLSSGMQIEEGPRPTIINLRYPEKRVSLIRLSINSKARAQFSKHNCYHLLDSELRRLGRLRHERITG